MRIDSENAENRGGGKRSIFVIGNPLDHAEQDDKLI